MGAAGRLPPQILTLKKHFFFLPLELARDQRDWNKLLSLNIIWSLTSVLFSVMELIFCLVAGTVLCFGCRMRTVLVTHRCCRCCRARLAQSQGCFSFSHCPASKGAGELGGDMLVHGFREIFCSFQTSVLILYSSWNMRLNLDPGWQWQLI